MSPITLYGLKTCDTCRKALKALDAAGKPAEFVDVRAEADLDAKLPAWLGAVGADTLVNTRSTTWRGLSDAERARKDTDPAGLLKDHPALIKRPVIETGGAVHVGWTKDVQAALEL
ncbi:MAG: ArsC/Spx/MgsR family protein [Oceanicaulis sp.]